MSLEVALHRAAYEELVEASAWYESKRSGLALEFIAEIERCFSLAAEHPFQFASVREGIRRIVAKHFPYAVYYRVEKDRIVVLGVFHGKRNPALWPGRT